MHLILTSWKLTSILLYVVSHSLFARSYRLSYLTCYPGYNMSYKCNLFEEQGAFCRSQKIIRLQGVRNLKGDRWT